MADNTYLVSITLETIMDLVLYWTAVGGALHTEAPWVRLGGGAGVVGGRAGGRQTGYMYCGLRI